ncbi:MAG: hypothetical protein HYZ27_06565 [Deltaproteobacteria bacterium]|nr:hypothetical protein [Deltaproteobacteria bacterium]
MQSTLLRVFERRLLKKNARERILSTFDKIQEAPGLEGPLFVLAHLLVPHPPYLFDRNGAQPPDLPFKLQDEVWKNKAAHVEQTLFTNVKVLAMVDALLGAPGPAPIIIVQGDHGSAASGTFKSPTEELIRERMRILSAFYFPEHRRPQPPADITPVNTFRFIFTHFFAARLPLLEDKLYFSTYERPYAFEDVTALLRATDGSASSATQD